MAVKVLKLVSGEEIVADVEVKETTLELKNPVRFLMTQEGVGMMPYQPIVGKARKLIEISKEHVMFETEVEADFANEYSTHFGSGIVLANTSSLKLH